MKLYIVIEQYDTGEGRAGCVSMHIERLVPFSSRQAAELHISKAEALDKWNQWDLHECELDKVDS
jgi:hypothetical protein